MMSSVNPFDNLIIKRRSNIIKYVNDFLPKDISKLISEYDYHLEGKEHILNKNDFDFRVDCIAVLPDGRIVVASNDQTIKILNLQTGKYDITFRAHSDIINCVATLPDPDGPLGEPGRIISGSTDKTLKIWNLTKKKCDITLYDNASVMCVIVLPDGSIASGSTDGTIKIWNLQTQKCINILSGHHGTVWCIIVLPDGRIVSASSDNTLKIWKSYVCEITLKGHKNNVYCIDILPDDLSGCCFAAQRIVSGSADRTIKVWNSLTGNCDITFCGHTNSVYCVKVLPDARIVSGSTDKTIRIWNTFVEYHDNNITQTGNCDATLYNYGNVYSMDVHPEGFIISGSNVIKIWS
jgi:WD40 repeat protein